MASEAWGVGREAWGVGRGAWGGGACTGQGPQMANARPTPKPENLGPPWPPGTSENPAGYSREGASRGQALFRFSRLYSRSERLVAVSSRLSPGNARD